MLNEEQIQSLKNYCSSKGVAYYDLEQEIVDHLASVIEEEQTKFPAKSFDAILNEKTPNFSKEWKTIETGKRKSLRSAYLKEFWNEFVSYFTVPKIVITIFISLLWMLIIKYNHGDLSKSMTSIFAFIPLIFNLIIRKPAKLNSEMKKRTVAPLLTWKIQKRMFSLSQFVFLIYAAIMILTKQHSNNFFVKSLIIVLPFLIILHSVIN